LLLCTVIHDREIRRGNGTTSLLTMPLGTATVLDYLCRAAASIDATDVVVLANDKTNRAAIARAADGLECNLRILTEAELDNLIHTLEPSDRMLFIDPRHWPTAGYDFEQLQREADSFSGAVHAIAMGADDTDASERVLIDRDGRVRGIRRLYQRVTRIERPHGSISYSLVPVAALSGCRYVELTGLPVVLAQKGILSRDVPLDCDLFDVSNDRDYLALCELATTRALRNETPDDYSRLNEHAILGRGAIVHHSARIIGPVVIQPRATVGPQATIIGPATIGRDCKIGTGALVAQAVLPDATTVAAGASLRHCVAADYVSVMDATASAHDLWMADAMAIADEDAIAPELIDAGIVSRGTRICKRALDFTASAAGLMVLSPLFAFVAILIKLGSPGPVFFVHQREGRGGRRFGCLKFRTMRSDAHRRQRELLGENDLDGPHFKIARDPRITRIGRILRNTNIDELPQLINVLLGHMSLVGPRPSPFRENQICVPWRRARLSVRPGITGLWQICRSERGDGDFQQWIYYDILYVRNMSMWLDVKMLFATAWALVSGREIRVESMIACANVNASPAGQPSPITNLKHVEHARLAG
jgi:lipopolysaccharide/colanic/teichoic acid biosynthesis glycosyltransferase/acetyltransferase-like isoleucine patch superfamily enzyme